MNIEFDKEYYITKRENCFATGGTKYSSFGNVLYDNEKDVEMLSSVFSTYIKLKFTNDSDGTIRMYMKEPWEE